MMRYAPLYLLLAVALMVPTPLQAATPQVSAYAMLHHYTTAINQADYAAAYSDWLTPYQTYEQFALGYGDTQRIEPYLGHYQPADTASGRIPAVLLGYHFDGTLASYWGCYRVRYANGRWGIEGGAFHPIATTPATTKPDQGTIEAYLQVNCYALQDTVADSFVSITPDSNLHAYLAPQTLRAYYAAINVGDYAAAYNTYWLTPCPGPQPNGCVPSDYRPPYADYVAGYADTATVTVYTGDYLFGGAAAGKPYLSGFLPVVLISQHTDGNVESFYGCYVMGAYTMNSLGIVNGRLMPLVDDMPTADAIFDALKVDCAGLGMSF